MATLLRSQQPTGTTGRGVLHLALEFREAVNARCFADQARRIAELGGEQACREAFAFNHTPTPTERAGG